MDIDVGVVPIVLTRIRIERQLHVVRRSTRATHAEVLGGVTRRFAITGVVVRQVIPPQIPVRPRRRTAHVRRTSEARCITRCQRATVGAVQNAVIVIIGILAVRRAIAVGIDRVAGRAAIAGALHCRTAVLAVAHTIAVEVTAAQRRHDPLELEAERDFRGLPPAVSIRGGPDTERLACRSPAIEVGGRDRGLDLVGIPVPACFPLTQIHAIRGEELCT